jgi:hypothetical protein
MENNEHFVETTENVEQTTEQTPVKTYTQEEVDAMMGKRVARTEAKIRKEYDRKYGGLMETLRAGTGKESVEEVNDTFQKFYASKGVKMPQKPNYSAKDNEVLAKAEAEEIISGGIEDVVDEVERLQKIGAGNRTAREEAVYKVLGKHLQNSDRIRQLSELGATEDVYTSKEFQDFMGKFNPNTPVSEVYDLYKAKHPTEKPKTMGSMKNSTKDSVVKDYYSPEEAKKFTNRDFDKTPGLYEAVVNSMAKWRK